MDEHEASLRVQYDVDGFVGMVCHNENNLSHRPAKRPHYYTSDLFKVTIDDGVITDIWHRDDTIGSTRIISPHFDLDVTYRNCPTISGLTLTNNPVRTSLSLCAPKFVTKKSCF